MVGWYWLVEERDENEGGKVEARNIFLIYNKGEKTVSSNCRPFPFFCSFFSFYLISKSDRSIEDGGKTERKIGRGKRETKSKHASV